MLPYNGTDYTTGTQQPPQPQVPTPSSPYTTPIPDASGYLQTQLLAKTAYQNALARLSNQRSGLLRSAGYVGQFGDNGQLQGLRVDPNNPFGGYQQMRRGDAIEDQSANWNARDRGLADSGLANHMHSNLRYQHAGQAAQFGTNLMGSLGDLANQQQDAFGNYNNSMWQAQLQAAQAAIAGQNFNPALYGNQPNPIDPNNYQGGGDMGFRLSPQQEAAALAALRARASRVPRQPRRTGTQIVAR